VSKSCGFSFPFSASFSYFSRPLGSGSGFSSLSRNEKRQDAASTSEDSDPDWLVK
jgi:hypothetical protein